MIVCSTCGRESESDVRFCAACGSPLGAPSQVAREERKVVSVVFVDLVGHTARSESADPEDVRATLAPGTSSSASAARSRSSSATQ